MIWLVSRLRHDFRTWDRATQIGFVTALVLLALSLLLFWLAPEAIRQQVCFGLLAILGVTEALVMWGNRRMVAPITRAQRAYLDGDFAAVVAELAPLRQSGRADFRALTLLGNTYRQMGKLDESAGVLSEAVDKSPDHHYSLYGFGRTLIVQGRYAQGAETIKRALEQGAPSSVRFDLAEAYYRDGRWAEARAVLETVAEDGEPQRALIVALWRFQRGVAGQPARSLIEKGLPYWRAQAGRFADTPYGLAVAREVRQLEMLLT
jgi:tetratricopeptide (TPR) repeat protein